MERCRGADASWPIRGLRAVRTGDTIEEPRVVITCRARLTGPHACTRVCTYTPLHQGRVPLSPFHRTPLRSPIIPPLSTCKPRVSTRSDPRPHLLSMNSLPPPPLQLMNAIIYLRTRPSSREQRGCNNVDGEREREKEGGLVYGCLHAWTEITVGFLFGWWRRRI